MSLTVDASFLDKRWSLIAVVIIFLIVGVIGNIVVVIVYAYAIKRTEERYFLPLLAVADCVAIVASSTFQLLLDVNRPYFPSDSLCKAFQFLSWSSTQFSAMMLLLLAVQRYLKICRPLGTQMNLKWRRILLASIFFGTFVTSSPICAFSGIHEDEIKIRGQNITETAVFCVLHSGFNDKGSDDYYKFLFIFNILLFVSIITLYLLIGRQVYVRYRSLKKANFAEMEPSGFNTSKADSEQLPDPSETTASDREKHRSGIRQKFTTIFSLIITFYVISYLPFFIVIRSGVNDPEYLYSLSTWKANVILFLHRCYVINNIANPIIYSIFDSTFRRGLRKCFRFMLGKN